jgi:serine protease Do
VIVEVSQEAVADAADLQKRIDQAKKDGRRTVLFLVASGEGDTRWVTVPLQ